MVVSYCKAKCTFLTFESCMFRSVLLLEKRPVFSALLPTECAYQVLTILIPEWLKAKLVSCKYLKQKKTYTERAKRVFHFLPRLHMNEIFQLNCYLDDGRRTGDRPTWQLPANRVSEAVTNKSTFHSASINIRSWSWQETLLPTFEKCDRIQDDFKPGTF